MKAFHLAPHVGVTYWRQSPIGITPAEIGAKADFAIVGIVAGGVETSARFELPFERDKLEAMIAGLNVAYGLGHRDRTNRMRRLLGHRPIPLDYFPLLAERCADDRD